MATYAIGDLQGCHAEFMALLRQISFDPHRDDLFLVGDLVNRGPGSLEVLRWVYRHREAVHIVLGNHDLHLIAAFCGQAKIKGRDTLAEVLAAPDAELLIKWLWQQPLVRRLKQYVFVHAGLPPAWGAKEAEAYSQEVQQVLTGDQRQVFLTQMYGNEPAYWNGALKGWPRLRYIVNSCTRMRLLATDGGLDLAYKGELADAPGERYAWFDAPERQSKDVTVVCGHWSALGLLIRPDVYALDTGCVWGGQLTAIRLDDAQVFQEPSRQVKSTEWA